MTIGSIPPAPPLRRKGSLILRLAVVMGLFALAAYGVYAFKSFGNAMGAKYMAGMKNAPQTVSTMLAAPQVWQDTAAAVASLRAERGTDLSFETAGVIDAIRFHSGDDVRAGAVLATMRPNDLPARIEALQAQSHLAEITIARDRRQFAERAVAQATLDADEANLRNLKAQVAQQRALLDLRTLRAPFAGHLGIRQIDPGQYVAAGAQVVTLQALDPLFADFYLPQSAVQSLRVGQAATLSVDAYPDRAFTGAVAAINPRVDPANRNVQVRAVLRNADRALLPGMFGSVSIASAPPRAVLTAPQTAVTYNPYGDTVFVVADKDSQGHAGLFAQQRFVKTGRTRGDQVQVLDGLAAGDRIVTTGQNKLRNGTPVRINDAVQPAFEAHPQPRDR